MNSPPVIERSLASDAQILTQIAKSAKRHWGYPEAWIQQWHAALTITPAAIAAQPTYHVREDGAIAGFYLLRLEGNAAHLDHLWIAPPAMGKGSGRLLYEHSEQVARESSARRIVIVADPNAEGFYRRMGAIRCGEEAAPIDGQPRFLPRLEKILSPSPATRSAKK